MGTTMTTTTTTIDFLKALLANTTGPAYICSFTNERLEGGERHIIGRNFAHVQGFMEKWDINGRGTFVCVSTQREGTQKRNKENCKETNAGHTDIDFKGVDGLGAEPRGEVLKQLKRLKYQPSAIVFSGNGIHVYYFFKEPVDTQANKERLEAFYRQLADVMAGDLAVCEVSRVMRLPGSRNSKDGASTPVEIIELHPERRYDLEELEEWLSEQSPVMLRVEREIGKTVGEIDPFAEYAKQVGFKPSIDVQARLDAMMYMGAGDSSVHQTQIQCAAAMLSKGTTMEEVVDVLLKATRVAAGAYGARWNWRIEERNIRRDCDGWIKKHPPEEKKKREPARETAPERKPERKPEREPVPERKPEPVKKPDLKVIDGGGGAAVAQATMPGITKAPPKDVPSVVVGGLINAIRKDGRDIMLTEGEVWLYKDGVWQIMTASDEQWLRSLIQRGFDQLGEAKKTAALNNTWKLLVEHPELYKRKVEWSDDKVIVCGNGVLDIDTRQFSPHGPQWCARRKITTTYDPAATCPQFLALLASMFSLHPSAQAAIEMYREWLGAALAVPRLTREQRKALLVVGKSRSGKTELSSCARDLIGEPVASPSVSEISETFGMQNFIGKSAWIRDDAINEGDRLDPQRFKIIVTGEPIAIRRMAQAALETRLQIPVLLTANSLPRARDASDAVYNRSIVLRLDRVISEREAAEMRTAMGVPAGLSIGSHIMAAEAPGVLNWALDGLAKLLQRGLFDVPDSVADDIREFKEANNPVAEFARAAVMVSKDHKVERSDLLCAFHGWQREEQGEEARASGGRWFFPRLRELIEGATDQKSNGMRFVTGIALTDEGLHYWLTHRVGQQLRGGSSGFSTACDQVNRPLERADHPSKKPPSIAALALRESKEG
jgi:P4 family phage/plasmid primase-like protien